nr:hypothetical protein [Cellulosimicrobium sp. MM]
MKPSSDFSPTVYSAPPLTPNETLEPSVVLNQSASDPLPEYVVSPLSGSWETPKPTFESVPSVAGLPRPPLSEPPLWLPFTETVGPPGPSPPSPEPPSPDPPEPEPPDPDPDPPDPPAAPPAPPPVPSELAFSCWSAFVRTLSAASRSVAAAAASAGPSSEVQRPRSSSPSGPAQRAPLTVDWRPPRVVSSDSDAVVRLCASLRSSPMSAP